MENTRQWVVNRDKETDPKKSVTSEGSRLATERQEQIESFRKTISERIFTTKKHFERLERFHVGNG